MKFLGIEDIPVELIKPSPFNPRMMGLTPEEPSIKQLAGSIQRDSQLNPIITRKMKANSEVYYEIVDGDRRYIAIAEILKLKTIRAAVYEMNEMEAFRVRFVSNIVKEELHPIEKGSYCKEYFKRLAKEENLSYEEAWNNKGVKFRILSQIAQEIGVGISTITGWIALWDAYPIEAQKFIARNKEELRRGLGSPTLAQNCIRLAKMLKIEPQEVLKQAVKNSFSSTLIEMATYDAENGKLLLTPKNWVQELKRFNEEYSRRGSVRLKRTLLEELKTIASKNKIRLEAIIEMGLAFALNHKREFQKFILQQIGKSEES